MTAPAIKAALEAADYKRKIAGWNEAEAHRLFVRAGNLRAEADRIERAAREGSDDQ